MKIKLDDKHYLNSDRFCCWITCEYTAKNGKTAERTVSGYYRTFEQCVENYIDKSILSATAENITQLRAEISKLKKTVKGWKLNGEAE